MSEATFRVIASVVSLVLVAMVMVLASRFALGLVKNIGFAKISSLGLAVLVLFVVGSGATELFWIAQSSLTTHPTPVAESTLGALCALGYFGLAGVGFVSWHRRSKKEDQPRRFVTRRRLPAPPPTPHVEEQD